MDTGGLSAFSESYEEARGKFLAAAQAAGAELVALPVTEDEQGKYSIDIAICASKSAGPARGLVVISSGVHGVEGYAGSAIQISLLKQWKERPVASTAVFVHAVNPYGMAHFRRFNENNVDLNRNCLLPEQFERLRRSDVMAPVYGYFDPLFNPTVPPGAFYRNIGVWFEMAGYVARYGIGYIKNALVAGTYQHEKGIFFGGKELQPSHVLLRDFMTKRFGTTKAAEVAWVDVHTGLGPTGVDVMLGTKSAREMEELFPKVEGECDGYQALGMKVESVLEKRCGSNDVTLNQSGLSASQSAGYEFTVGVLSSEWVTQFFAKDSGEVLQVAQEFGTLGNLTVARAMMLENCGYHYDRANHEYWRSFTRDAFYVRTEDWKLRVLRRGEAVFRRLAERVAAP